MGLEVVFDDCLDRNQAVLYYKTMYFTQSPYGHFFNGLSPCLWAKIGNFVLVWFGTKWA